MAVYYSASSWATASETCKIPRTELIDYTTVYVIEVSVPPFTWHVKHRYNDFYQLHEKLTTSHHVDKSLLPPKKWFGCQSEFFIAKRQADLQLYIQTLIHQFNNSFLPSALSLFLDFHLYEVRGIVGKLAEKFYFQGDLMLLDKPCNQFSPLELHAILERLKLAEPTFSDGNKIQDIGHVLSFISEVKHLIILGSNENIGSSNIVPNNLVFNLAHFKKLQSLEIRDCLLDDTLQSIEPVNQTVQDLSVHNTLKDISSITLCGIIHWSPFDFPNVVPTWNCVTVLNLSHNFLTVIHPSIKLFPCVAHLDLSYNSIQEIENFECLPYLEYVNLSYNNIQHVVSLHTRLGNIRSLLLNGNKIDCLKGFTRLFSLVELELESNCVTSLAEVNSISKLPCLEKVKLTNNPVCDSLDYRAHVLKAFGNRANELTLDNEKPCQKEIDRVSLLQALDASQQNAVHLDQKSHLSEKGTSAICHHSYSGIQHSQRFSVRSDFFEYRQQVAALRKLGGVNWLSLLNQMQGDLVKDEKASLADANSPDSCNNNSSLTVEVVNHSLNIHPVESSDYPASHEHIFPEWVLAIDASNQSIVDYLKSLANSDSIMKVPLTSLSNPQGLLWLIYSPKQNMTILQVPVCVVLFHTHILIFKVEDFPQMSSLENVHLEPLLPTMSYFQIFLSSNIVSFLVGPRKSYIEIHVSDDNGMNKHIFLMPNGIFANIYIEMLESVYKHVVSFKASPFTQEILNLEMLSSDKEFIHGSMIQCQILFSERIILLQTVGSCSLFSIHYLTVTPSHVIFIEENINFPQFHSIPCYQYSQFRACTVIGAQTNVNSIYMGSDCDHFIKTEMDDAKKLNDATYKNFPENKYAHAPLLVVEFDPGVMIKIVFLCFQDRSNFLDAFLCARTVQQ